MLHDVSFHIRPGESIALVGPTGAGKSTVVNLLCRFSTSTADESCSRLRTARSTTSAPARLHSLRSQLGIMLQDSFIFSGTIMDNIRYGRLDATNQEVEAAARAVRAHDFISQMDMGYDTVVGERGGSLSQGGRSSSLPLRVRCCATRAS